MKSVAEMPNCEFAWSLIPLFEGVDKRLTYNVVFSAPINPIGLLAQHGTNVITKDLLSKIISLSDAKTVNSCKRVLFDYAYGEGPVIIPVPPLIIGVF